MFVHVVLLTRFTPFCTHISPLLPHLTHSRAGFKLAGNFLQVQISFLLSNFPSLPLTSHPFLSLNSLSSHSSPFIHSPPPHPLPSISLSSLPHHSPPFPITPSLLSHSLSSSSFPSPRSPPLTPSPRSPPLAPLPLLPSPRSPSLHHSPSFTSQPFHSFLFSHSLPSLSLLTNSFPSFSHSLPITLLPFTPLPLTSSLWLPPSHSLPSLLSPSLSSHSSPFFTSLTLPSHSIPLLTLLLSLSPLLPFLSLVPIHSNSLTSSHSPPLPLTLLPPLSLPLHVLPCEMVEGLKAQ